MALGKGFESSLIEDVTRIFLFSFQTNLIAGMSF